MTDLVTRAEYKAFKGIGGDTDDTVIDEIIITISAFVERYCGRTFIDNASLPGVIEYWDSDTTGVLLKQFPVISVDYVGVSLDGGLTYTQLVEDSADKAGFFVDDEDKEEVRVLTQIAGAKFLLGYDTPFRSLKITYLAGYINTGAIPTDLKLACYSLVEYYLDEQYTPGKALAGATLDNPLSLTGAELPAHIRRILDLYRVSI